MLTSLMLVSHGVSMLQLESLGVPNLGVHPNIGGLQKCHMLGIRFDSGLDCGKSLVAGWAQQFISATVKRAWHTAAPGSTRQLRGLMRKRVFSIAYDELEISMHFGAVSIVQGEGAAYPQ